jgi:hypothetical protein
MFGNFAWNINLIMKKLLFISITAWLITGCRQSPTDLAFKWSTDIKHKILEDVNLPVDSFSIDSFEHSNFFNVTCYNNGIKTKLFRIRTSTGDTGLSIFYSKDQDFEIVRELCPVDNRSFEGIRYKGKHLGLAEFRFCDGTLKEQGYRFNEDVGIWKKWDSIGNLISFKDYGNINSLYGLYTIKYGR